MTTRKVSLRELRLSTRIHYNKWGRQRKTCKPEGNSKESQPIIKVGSRFIGYPIMHEGLDGIFKEVLERKSSGTWRRIYRWPWARAFECVCRRIICNCVWIRTSPTTQSVLKKSSAVTGECKRVPVDHGSTKERYSDSQSVHCYFIRRC